jgi:hypothetical protein
LATHSIKLSELHQKYKSENVEVLIDYGLIDLDDDEAYLRASVTAVLGDKLRERDLLTKKVPRMSSRERGHSLHK